VSEKFLISVVLATYNWPQALQLCLQGLASQTDTNFEVVIADDGSREETSQLIKTYSQSSQMMVSHVWQPDIGFRKAVILNKAIAASRGKYLVFLDGDCLVQPDFIKNHRKLSQDGVMVTGSRILLGEALTCQLCENGNWSYKEFFLKAWRYRLCGALNKILPLMLKLPNNPARMYTDFEWRRIKGCNMAAWRDDALNIHGFDEDLQGWGHEDADFVFRLQRSGIKRKSGAWATEVLHLWHPSASKENAVKNAEKVRAKILAK
jgi:glycosyltransferase involved in cell wall biosynthesis